MLLLTSCYFYKHTSVPQVFFFFFFCLLGGNSQRHTRPFQLFSCKHGSFSKTDSCKHVFLYFPKIGLKKCRLYVNRGLSFANDSPLLPLNQRSAAPLLDANCSFGPSQVSATVGCHRVARNRVPTFTTAELCWVCGHKQLIKRRKNRE